MSNSIVPEVKSWSYSRYRDYTRCPAFFKYKHLLKISEGPDSPAMLRGSALGKLAEDYFKGRLGTLPKEFAGPLGAHFAAARKLADKGLGTSVFVEDMWCFNSKLQPVPKTEWDSIWLRVKMDLCGIADGVIVPVDLKSGRYRPDDLASYLEQLEIYGLAGLCKYPELEGASPRLWFFDAGVEYPQCNHEEIYIPRKDVPLLKIKWAMNIKPMFTDKRFEPKPNSKCSWCAYSCSNGGTCKF